MCRDGFLTSADVRRGYVKPLGQPWREVVFANVGERAIFEGCIILGSTAKVEADAQQIRDRAKRVPKILTDPKLQTFGLGIVGEQFRWPKRTISFRIDGAVANPQRVRDAIDHWHQTTSIRFKPRSNEDDFVDIVRVESGCASAVGRQGGRQELVLADGCAAGQAIHELGHAVGLWHEQSRADRDQFIEVRLDNIDPSQTHNFDQHILDGVPLSSYDYGSIMHYPPNAFSLDTEPTIVPRRALPPGVILGQRDALGAGDIAAVELLYQGEAQSNA